MSSKFFEAGIDPCHHSRHRPVIGIISNCYEIDGQYEVSAGSMMMSQAVAEVAQATPLIVPADPALVCLEDIMSLCDGFLFPGGRPNVHPSEYGAEETPAHGAFDRARDAVALPLIRACVRIGQPVFGICRGFQEMNVAFGGTLDPEIRDLPGRMNHRMPPDASLDEIFAPRHAVSFQQGGVFHHILGACKVMTNTLHGQGIARPGEHIVVDGHAPDGTPEAIYVSNASGFALAVQWHPEWRASEDPVSRPLFEAFGHAAAAWAAGKPSVMTPQSRGVA